MDNNPGTLQEWIRISDLSQKTGVSRYTIHYYLKEHLLPPPLKTGRTMALYSNVHIECLRLIRDLREKRKMPIVAVRNEVRRRFGQRWELTGLTGVLDGKKAKRYSKGDRQRQRIVETAVELFSQKGYHRTHVSHITDALHLSKGAFYQYFENKNHLFIAVFDHLVNLLTNDEESIDRLSNFLERMRERARSYFTFYKKYHKIFDIIRAESIGQEEKTGMSIDIIYQKMLGALVADVKKAQEQGLIRSGEIDPEMRTLMLFGAYDFMCYHIIRKGKPYSLEEVLDVLDGFFWR